MEEGNRLNLESDEELKDFSNETKKDILSIITDSPTIVRVGDKEYEMRDMRYYSIYRICQLVTRMKSSDDTIKEDSAILTALCTDLDAMCEVMAIILCNHYFTAEGNSMTFDKMKSRNDELISIMKAKVMQSTFDANQWAAIILGAIKSIDLSAFFLLRKSVSMVTDSLMQRKKKSMETASKFMEAQSLQMPQTSSGPSLNTD